MSNRWMIAAAIALVVSWQTATAAGDSRQVVELPAPMTDHMLANMRDHLAALHEIQEALAMGDWNAAAEVAESRLGTSSLDAHGASHMAQFMPESMRAIGSAMHGAASRFARSAAESAVDGDLAGALGALAEVTRQCVACHAAFRVR